MQLLLFSLPSLLLQLVSLLFEVSAVVGLLVLPQQPAAVAVEGGFGDPLLRQQLPPLLLVPQLLVFC